MGDVKRKGLTFEERKSEVLWLNGQRSPEDL
jgi:hypothetical protein